MIVNLLLENNIIYLFEMIVDLYEKITFILKWL